MMWMGVQACYLVCSNYHLKRGQVSGCWQKRVAATWQLCRVSWVLALCLKG